MSNHTSKLNLSWKYKAKVDTTTQVSGIDYIESQADRNLGGGKSATMTRLYDGDTTSSYSGVIEHTTWELLPHGDVFDPKCYRGSDLVREGDEMNLYGWLDFVHIEVVSAIGGSDLLGVRLGTSCVLRPISVGTGMTIPFVDERVDTAIYVQDPNYSVGLNELTVNMYMCGTLN